MTAETKLGVDCVSEFEGLARPRRELMVLQRRRAICSVHAVSSVLTTVHDTRQTPSGTKTVSPTDTWMGSRFGTESDALVST